MYECKCDCGNTRYVIAHRLLSGSCFACRDCTNLTRRKYKTGIDKILSLRFNGMRNRCYCKGSADYANYGGRGIRICDEWLNDTFAFIKWAKENGFRPDLSIDRIDVNGPYAPWNCRWVSTKVQGNNKRVNQYFELNGLRMTYQEWSEFLGLPSHTVSYWVSTYGLEKARVLIQDNFNALRFFKEGSSMPTDYTGNTIKTLTMCAQMRVRPSMWGFQIASVEGPLIQIKEIYDNAADEALDRSRIYPINITFFVSRDKSTYYCMIQDFGRGIPLDKLCDCFTKEFTSGKYEGKYGGASTGTNGVGSKASAAFSNSFEVFTKRKDGFGYLRIEKGVVRDHQTFRPIDKDDSTIGTTVIFQPDPTIFACISEMFTKGQYDEPTGFEKHLDRITLYSMIKGNVAVTVRKGPMLKPNVLKSMTPVDKWHFLTNPANYENEIVLQTDASTTPRMYVTKKFNLKEPLWELGELHKQANGAEDPLSYDIDVFTDPRTLNGDGGIIGAVNATPISHPDSSHISMLQTVLKDQLTDNIADSEAQAFFESKYRLPISGCISVGWLGAEFIGQDKSRFENRQFADCYRSNLRKVMRKLGETNPDLWDNLWDLIKENFELEYAKFSKKNLGLNKSLKNITYDLLRADSYENCESKNNQITELFITEGDSAAGRVKTARSAVTQAILKLRGKPINALRSTKQVLARNVIYRDMSMLLGVSPSDKNLDNMRFKNIVIVTDADADGYHIVVLLIGIFYSINPLILSEGRVQVTNPPLYSLMDNRSVIAYLRDDWALRDARINSYKVLLDIDMQVDGSDTWIHLNTNHEAFRDICGVVWRIGTILTHQADLLNIDYLVLEQLIHVAEYLDENNVNTEKVKDILMLDEAIWDKENNVLVIVQQGMESRIPLAKLKETIELYILPEYKLRYWDRINLFVSTKYADKYKNEPCTFAMLYQIFCDIDKVYKVRRFKGLGEMNQQSIDQICVNPSTRCFTTIRGETDAKRLYSMLGVDTEARKKLIAAGYDSEE